MSEGKARGPLQQAGDRLASLADTLTGRPHYSFPDFDQLPKVEGQPQGCIWGIFDKPGGEKDEIGSQ